LGEVVDLLSVQEVRENQLEFSSDIFAEENKAVFVDIGTHDEVY